MNKKLISFILVAILAVVFIGGAVYKQSLNPEVSEPTPNMEEESTPETSPLTVEETKPTPKPTKEPDLELEDQQPETSIDNTTETGGAGDVVVTPPVKPNQPTQPAQPSTPSQPSTPTPPSGGYPEQKDKSGGTVDDGVIRVEPGSGSVGTGPHEFDNIIIR